MRRSASAAQSMRSEKLRTVSRDAPARSGAHVVRGQFDGYRDVRGVAPHSEVETFVRVAAADRDLAMAVCALLHPCGQCLPVTATEVFVDLKTPPMAVFDPRIGRAPRTTFRFQLGPK